MLKKFFISLSIVLSLSFTSCGGGSSDEAKELLSKILQFVGIPHDIIVNVCQDSNLDGVCGGGELFTKLTIKKGESVSDILRKLSLTSDGRYFLKNVDPTLPILVEFQDEAKVNQNSGKFTLEFDAFENEEQNETKEISILEAMVDADGLTKAEADKFRTLKNKEAQDKYYATLLNDLETNINTLRANGLDNQKAVIASIKEMADETKANQERADKINSCGDNQTCVDEEIKKISDELIIDKNETQKIPLTQSPAVEPTPTPTQSTDQTFKSTLKKTGQTMSYEQFDDGDYQIGITPSYSRSGDIVTDNVTGLQWQDDEEVGQVEKNWEDAKSYCSALSLGAKSDWRLPTAKELMMIVDNAKYDLPLDSTSTLDSTFVNVTSRYSWSLTLYASDSSRAWVMDFGNGIYWGSKSNEYSVRCVRGEL